MESACWRKYLSLSYVDQPVDHFVPIPKLIVCEEPEGERMNRNPKDGPQCQLPVVDQLIDYSAVIFESQSLETIKTNKVKPRHLMV